MKSRSKDIDISDDFVNKQVNDFGTNNNNNNVDYSSLSRFYPFTINNNTRIDKSP
jgi:hypothetical protein